MTTLAIGGMSFKDYNPYLKLGCKLVYLFCLLQSNLLDYASPNHIIFTAGNLSTRRGALALFRGVWTYGVKVIEFLSFL